MGFDWQFDRELCTFTGQALYLDPSLMRLDQLFGNRQPKTAVGAIAHPCAVSAPETVEDKGQVFFRDAGAIVADEDANSAWNGLCFEGNRPALGCMTQCIRYQV